MKQLDGRFFLKNWCARTQPSIPENAESKAASEDLIKACRMVALALCAALVLLLLLVGAGASEQQAVKSADAKIEVRQNILVSGSHPTWAHDEVMLSVDPTNSDRMVACSIVLVPEKAKRITTAYASADGGSTWQSTFTSDNTTESSDPICYFGPDGTAHFSTESTLESAEKVVEIYGSGDGGATWTTRVAIPIRFEGYDRQFMVADTTNGEFHGRLYLNAWTLVRSIDADDQSVDRGDELESGITVIRSIDKGEHWSGFVKRASLGGRWVGEPGNCVVPSTGMLSCIFIEPLKVGIPRISYAPAEGDLPNARLRLFTSLDGGESLRPAMTISEIVDTQIHPGISLPQLAVDGSSSVFKDRLYAIWQGHKNRHNEILLSYSADEGATWSSPRKVNDEPRSGPRNPYMPEIAVNQSGILAVGWYDAGDSENKVERSVRLTASLDGGDTFLPSVEISSSPHRANEGESWPLYAAAGIVGKDIQLDVTRYLKHITGGETWGLTTDSTGQFHALWVDDRSGIDQMWTSAINVVGAVYRNGSEELSRLRDVSEKVAVKVTQIRTDQVRREYSLTVCLQNTSPETLTLPIKLRMLDTQSTIEAVEPTNATNRLAVAGALWDFSAADRQTMEPRSESVCRVLSFKLAGSPFAISVMGFNPEQFTSTVRFRVLGNAEETVRH